MEEGDALNILGAQCFLIQTEIGPFFGPVVPDSSPGLQFFNKKIIFG